MPKLKTRKSVAKRITITPKGKILASKVNQNHFNAKDSGTKRQSKRKDLILDVTLKKVKRVLN